MLEKLFSGPKSYYVWLLFLLCVIAGCGLVYLDQLQSGLGITGMNREVSWGLYISQFTYFVGVAASAVMLVLPAYFHHYKKFKRMIIFGEFMAVAAVVMCALFIVVDLGQPQRMLNVMLHPTPNSVMFYDMIVLIGYLCLNIVIGWVTLEAERLDVEPPKWVKPLIYLSILWAFSIHTVTAFLYAGIPGRHYWLTAIMAARFLSSAFCSGPAILLLLLFLRQQHLRCILGAAGGFCRTALLGRLCHRGCALSGRLRLLCRSRGREIHPERFCILRFRLQKGPRGQLPLRVCRRLQHQFQICFLLRLGIPAQHHLTGGHFLRLCCLGFLLICLAAGKQAKPLLRLFLRQFFIPPGHFIRDVHRRGAEKRAELFILGHCLIVIFILRHSCPSCKYR